MAIARLVPGDIVELRWAVPQLDEDEHNFIAVFRANPGTLAMSAEEFFRERRFLDSSTTTCFPGALLVVLDIKGDFAKLFSSEEGVVFTSLISLALKKV